ncbi:hypothetical protein AMECASPLE_033856, partial [Ameca splendens]
PSGSSVEGTNEQTEPLKNLALILIIVLSTIITLLFLVIGVIVYKKHKAGGDTENEPDDVTYAAVQIKKKGSKVSKATLEQHASEQESTYSLIALKRGKNTLN